VLVPVLVEEELESNEIVSVTLEHIVSKTFRSKTAIDGYKWIGTYDEVIQKLDANNFNGTLSDSFQTSKCLNAIKLPPILMFQLERSHQTIRGKVSNSGTSSNICVQIPDVINMFDYVAEEEKSETETRTSSANNRAMFYLIGGILLVEDASSVSEDDEGGHYVTMFRNTTISNGNNGWFLIDDDTVQQIDQQLALDLFSGRTWNPRKPNVTETAEDCWYSGVLLVYQRKDFKNNIDVSSIDIQNLTLSSAKSSNSIMLNPPESDTYQTTEEPEILVGRRLQVKWAKGKFYSGIVQSYDSSTGKHCILYDDGDVKHYNLQKKTIKWEE
jgi:hypothetical protein